MPPTAARVPWSRDELIVACGLYFTVPFGQMHSRNPRIIEVARLLGRTPSSLAMKLVNFASLDPQHQARGIRGLQGGSRQDKEIWHEFDTNWDAMALHSEEKLQALEALSKPASPIPTPPADIVTENLVTRKVRTMQSFFRKAVLAAYESKCCITGNPLADLLVASHILPWSDFPEHRLNPSNGLCLAAHFDKAFDRCLITFDEHLRLVVGPEIKHHEANDSLRCEFLAREGQPLICPSRFAPGARFIANHRARFRAGKALNARAGR